MLQSIQMKDNFVECIPNYSEGRRLSVIQTITESISRIDGITVIDRHIDPDHNRTVITFVGHPQAVEIAAFESVKAASTLINMKFHQGEHPRIGATDVVPFVPIMNTSMKTCIQLAQNLGTKIGNQLQIPVYLYEHASPIPDRKNLSDIRRGGIELLRKKIKSEPYYSPDFGPSIIKSPGAVAIGARQPLIAFTVNLATQNVKIAKKIAKKIRETSGGLPHVKSIGIFVNNLAQVSLNITDYQKTPIAYVVDKIAEEATKHGVQIDHSEIVGLIPKDSVEDYYKWHMPKSTQLSQHILETHLDKLAKK